MKTFYVSLSKDLLHCYIVFIADDEMTVREYLGETYNRGGQWNLPWCSIYEEIPEIDRLEAIQIPAKCGPLAKPMFNQEEQIA